MSVIIGVVILLIITTIALWLFLVDLDILPGTIFGLTVPRISNYASRTNQIIIASSVIAIPTLFLIFLAAFHGAVVQVNNLNHGKITQLQSDYDRLISTHDWQEANDIVKETQVPNFNTNSDAHKRVITKCRPFIEKNHRDLLDLFPTTDTYDSIKDPYALAIECANLAKMKQSEASKILQTAHDTCIEQLQTRTRDSLDQYKTHLAAITNTPLDEIRQNRTPLTPDQIKLKSDKRLQLADCIERL